MGITTFKTFDDWWSGQTLIYLYGTGTRIGEIWRSTYSSRWTGKFYDSKLRWQYATEQELIAAMNRWREENT